MDVNIISGKDFGMGTGLGKHERFMHRCILMKRSQSNF